jgi:hypothetical protein
VLDERLGDALDAALNAPTPDERRALHDAARGILDEYREYVADEPIFADIDDNGFLPITVRATLDASLKAIDQQLRRQGAR